MEESEKGIESTINNRQMSSQGGEAAGGCGIWSAGETRRLARGSRAFRVSRAGVPRNPGCAASGVEGAAGALPIPRPRSSRGD